MSDIYSVTIKTKMTSVPIIQCIQDDRWGIIVVVPQEVTSGSRELCCVEQTISGRLS